MSQFQYIPTPIITEDPSYVSHVYWDGSKIIDTKGLAWVVNGTVPLLGSASGATAGLPSGAGPFSDANYYTNGSGSDVLDATGDRFGAAIVTGVSNGAGNVLVCNGTPATAGHFIQITAGQAPTFSSEVPGNQATSSTTFTTVGQLAVICWWRIGNNINIQCNLGLVATVNAGGAEVSGTSSQLYIGRYVNASNPFSGTIHEIVQGLGTLSQPASGTKLTNGMDPWQVRVQKQVMLACGYNNAFIEAR
jgi:hypothetical protein